MSVRDRYNSLYGDYATTMVQLMWQNDSCAVARCVKNGMDALGNW